MILPAINMRRTYLVARRDFLGYIKTWGFWISFLMPFVFGVLGFFASSWEFDLEPTRYEAILDETGLHGHKIRALRDTELKANERKVFEAIDQVSAVTGMKSQLLDIYDKQGSQAALNFLEGEFPQISNRVKLPKPSFIFVDPPSNDFEDLKEYINGNKTFMHEGKPSKLSGVLRLYEEDGKILGNHWSTLVNTDGELRFYSRYFRAISVENYLSSGGLTVDGLNDARQPKFEIESFNPAKEISGEVTSQAVTKSDMIPYVVAAVMTVMLWLTIFSGSYMLLTSMLEEKLNKLLEMMLASTRLSEIIFGKLLGVAALTLTAMIPYFLIGGVGIVAATIIGGPEVAAGLSNAFTLKMFIFFPVFLVLGYIFYGSFFIALGTLANSMQDAQTLTTPIMLILTMCVMVVPVGLNSPESPVLQLATWFPLSAPFAAIMRLPSDPPWWELIMSAGFVFLMALAVIWFAGRIFRFGVLSGAGVKGIWVWFKRVVLRRKTVG